MHVTYSFVTQVLIVFVQGEKFDVTGPSIAELVGKENVDKLDYMGWLIDQGADPKKVIFKL